MTNEDAVRADFEALVRTLINAAVDQDKTCVAEYIAVLAAFDAARVAPPAGVEGWQWVPKEPTEAMVQAAPNLGVALHPNNNVYDRALIYRAMLAAAPAQVEQQTAIELQGVAEALSEGDGAWRPCSGCHETEHGVARYVTYSAVLKCNLGSGCRECGGIGAVWDNTDYEDMARSILSAEQQTAGAVPISLLDKLNAFGEAARSNETTEYAKLHAEILAALVSARSPRAEEAEGKRRCACCDGSGLER